MIASRSPAPLTPLSAAERGIRLGARERITLGWLIGLLVGIALAGSAVVLGFTGPAPLAAVGIYSAVALALAVRSGVLLSRLRAG